MPDILAAAGIFAGTNVDGAGTGVLLAVFAVLVAVWCAAASWLGSHRRVVGAVSRHGHWLVPPVFIAVGVLVLTGAL